MVKRNSSSREPLKASGLSGPKCRGNRSAIFYAFGGLVVAGLLSWQHASAGLAEKICGERGGCAEVLASRYSSVAGVPIALVGAVFYAAMLLVLLVSMGMSWGRRWVVGSARWGSTVGAGVSIALMAIQFGVLRAFCPLCTLSAVLMILLAVSLWRGWKEMDAAAEPWTAAGLAMSLAAVGALIAATVALPSESATEVLAKVDGRAITMRELEREGRPAVRELQSRLHEEKRRWLEGRIAQIVIGDEAKKRGVSEEELARVEVDEKIRPQVRALDEWIAKQKAAAGNSSADWFSVRERSIEELREKRRDEWVAELRSGHRIEVLLGEPKGRAVQVDRKLAHVLGPEDAAVKLVLFSDFECPYCAELSQSLQRALEEFPTEVSVAYIHDPLEVHPKAFEAAVASEAAAEQGKFWLYHDRLMAQHGELDGKWMEHAKAIGLDVGEFAAAMKSGEARERVQKSLEQAKALKLRGVPELFLNGRHVGGLLTYEELKGLIKLERRKVRYVPTTIPAME